MFSWLFGTKTKAPVVQPQMLYIEGDGECETDVVGESHYMDAIRKVVDYLNPIDQYEHSDEWIKADIAAVLIPEPENKHDNNAIRVEIGNLKVGYLAREHAAKLKGQITSPMTVLAKIVGKWTPQGGNFGVKLDMIKES